MSGWKTKVVGITTVSAVVIVGLGTYWSIHPRSSPRAAPSGPAAGFREMGREAGLTFRMHFLPGEQGVTFKVNLYDHGCGAAVADFDGDGHDDVYFVNQLGPNALYRNKGDGTFQDVTAKAGVALGDRVCVAAAFGDYDNDGYPDLYVTSTRGGNVLFHNLGDGRFEDVSKQAGVAHVGHSQTATFFDYDSDGRLDLFVTNTARWTLDEYEKLSHYYPGQADFWEMAESPKEDNILYHNNGDGTFTDVTATAKLKGKGWGGDVAVFDYDEDGHIDLLVTNMFGQSQLYRNLGDGTFRDVTHDTLRRTSFGAIGSKAFDFNNDGHLDLFITDMHSDMWLPSQISPRSRSWESLHKKYDKLAGDLFYSLSQGAETEQRLATAFHVRYDEVLFGNTLFKKLPSGKFEEMSDPAGVETFWPWGIATGDFDNDGYEDIYIPSGMGYPYGAWPSSVLFLNNGNETFRESAIQAGMEPPPGGEYLPQKIAGQDMPRSSRSAAVADFDSDGRLDLVVNNFNDRAFYFHNDFSSKNWIAFRLTGTTYRQSERRKRTSRDAVGASVTLHLGKEVMVRQVQAAGGYLAQSSQRLHFGLGDRRRIDRVEIRWPSGIVQRLDSPAINTLHSVNEDASSSAVSRSSDSK